MQEIPNHGGSGKTILIRAMDVQPVRIESPMKKMKMKNLKSRESRRKLRDAPVLGHSKAGVFKSRTVLLSGLT